MNNKIKKVLKYLKWISIYLLILIALAISGYVYYLETSIDKVMSRRKQRQLMENINSSPELPESFYEVMNTYYPDAFRKHVWADLIDRMGGARKYKCQCSEIYIHPGYTDRWPAFTQLIVALEIEEYCSTKKCFEYYMSISEFGMNAKGIHEASRTYYKKEIDVLSDREVLELLLIQKAPSYYNPYRNRGRLSEAVNRIMKRE